METKLCRKCGRVLPIESFGKGAHQFDGRGCYCRECINARQMRYNAIRKQGRSVALARVSTEEILNELKYRLLWQEEDIIR